jgi:hypothetical protein
MCLFRTYQIMPLSHVLTVRRDHSVLTLGQKQLVLAIKIAADADGATLAVPPLKDQIGTRARRAAQVRIVFDDRLSAELSDLVGDAVVVQDIVCRRNDRDRSKETKQKDKTHFLDSYASL